VKSISKKNKTSSILLTELSRLEAVRVIDYDSRTIYYELTEKGEKLKELLEGWEV
jgi:DNA-binding HxlR family transcriptional regulator